MLRLAHVLRSKHVGASGLRTHRLTEKCPHSILSFCSSKKIKISNPSCLSVLSSQGVKLDTKKARICLPISFVLLIMHVTGHVTVIIFIKKEELNSFISFNSFPIWIEHPVSSKNWICKNLQESGLLSRNHYHIAALKHYSFRESF